MVEEFYFLLVGHFLAPVLGDVERWDDDLGQLEHSLAFGGDSVLQDHDLLVPISGTIDGFLNSSNIGDELVDIGFEVRLLGLQGIDLCLGAVLQMQGCGLQDKQT